jgi:hypothetical protein
MDGDRMRNIERRLAGVESLLQPPGKLWGRLEIHWRDAWPACKDAPGVEECSEHGPTCGVQVSRTRGRERVVVILGGPWLGV